MKAKYVGDASNPNEVVPDTFEAYGLTFEKRKFVEVPDELASKFDGNSHFETQGKDPEAK